MPSGEVRDAIETLASQGEFGPTVHPVHLRVASHVGALFLDLANSRGQVVEITAGGWEVVTDPPVRFVRPPGMRPLPVPVRGGTIEDLRPFLNITDQDYRLSPLNLYNELPRARTLTARLQINF